MDITITLFYQPIINLLIVLYRLFNDNIGLAVIAIAILSRLVTLPIVIRQRKMMVKSKEMNVRIAEIKEKYKNDKEKQQKELMAIQSEYLPSQIAGCLPLIIQVIVLLNIYNVIRELITAGASGFNHYAYSFVPAFSSNYKINYSFFNILDLSKHPADFSSNIVSFIPYIIVLIVLGITQYFSMKYSLNISNIASNSNSKVKNILNTTNKQDKKNKINTKDNKEEKKPDEDFGQIMQQSTQQTIVLFPIFYVFLAYNFATGLALYWIVINSFVIIQQFVLSRMNSNKVSLTDSNSPNKIINGDNLITK